jgi:hypothetical protein
MEFNTSQYQFTHGKLPQGNGLWFFQVKFVDGSGRLDSFFGSYTSAKLQLKQWLRDNNLMSQVASVEVMP